MTCACRAEGEESGISKEACEQMLYLLQSVHRAPVKTSAMQSGRYAGADGSPGSLSEQKRQGPVQELDDNATDSCSLHLLLREE